MILQEFPLITSAYTLTYSTLSDEGRRKRANSNSLVRSLALSFVQRRHVNEFPLIATGQRPPVASEIRTQRSLVHVRPPVGDASASAKQAHRMAPGVRHCRNPRTIAFNAPHFPLQIVARAPQKPSLLSLAVILMAHTRDPGLAAQSTNMG
jgi:hypothetical protein